MGDKKVTWLKKRCHVPPLSAGRVSVPPRRSRKTFLLIYARNHEWPRNVALNVPIHSPSLPFSKILLIRRAKLFRLIYNVVLKIVPTRIRGKLCSYSILMSLLKDLQPPVIGVRRLFLLIYNPKHVRNPQYSLSFDPNYVRKLPCSSLVYPNRLLDHHLLLLYPNRLFDHFLLLYPNRLLDHHLLLPYSLRASSRPINES
jgi:hypothetical protein